MKLMTKAIEKKFLKNSNDKIESVFQKKVIVKFFAPWISPWTWFAVEGQKLEDGDWRFYGLVFGHEKEFGYFLLSELESVNGPFGLKIERDLYFDNPTIEEVLNRGH